MCDIATITWNFMGFRAGSPHIVRLECRKVGMPPLLPGYNARIHLLPKHQRPLAVLCGHTYVFLGQGAGANGGRRGQMPGQEREGVPCAGNDVRWSTYLHCPAGSWAGAGRGHYSWATNPLRTKASARGSRSPSHGEKRKLWCGAPAEELPVVGEAAPPRQCGPGARDYWPLGRLDAPRGTCVQLAGIADAIIPGGALTRGCATGRAWRTPSPR